MASLVSMRAAFLRGDEEEFAGIRECSPSVDVWSDLEYERATDNASSRPHPHEDSDTLYGWIVTRVPDTPTNGKAPPAPHCRLLASLLQAHVAAEPDAWCVAAVQRWTHLLVSKSYPWFVCSVWMTHLPDQPRMQTALECAALMHSHTGVLHQLLHKGHTTSLWAIGAWWDEEEDDITECFRSLLAYKNRRFYTTHVVACVGAFPYADEAVSQKVRGALMELGGETEGALCMKALGCLEHLCAHDRSHGCLWHTPSLLEEAVLTGSAVVVRWVFRRCFERAFDSTAEAMGSRYWLEWLKHTQPLSQRNRGMVVNDLCMELLRQCRAFTTDEAWCDMLVAADARTSVLTVLLCTSGAHTIMNLVDTWTRETLARLSPTHTTPVYQWSTNMQADVKWSVLCANPAQWFVQVNTWMENTSGWTPFANALRWGTVQSVTWCLAHGASICAVPNCLTHTLNTVDNSLTLALSNGDIGVWHVFLAQVDRSWSSAHVRTLVRKWATHNHGESLAMALGRQSFNNRHTSTVQKLKMLLPYVHDEVLACKGTVVCHILSAWEHYAASYTYRSFHPHVGTPWTHPVVSAVLLWDAPLSSACVRTLLKLVCRDEQRESETSETLETLGRAGVEHPPPSEWESFLNMLYDRCQLHSPHHALQYLLERETEDVSERQLQVFLTHPATAKHMRGALDVAQRTALLLTAGKRSDATIRRFLRTAQDMWGWRLVETLPRRFEAFVNISHRHARGFTPSIGNTARLPALWWWLLVEGALPLVICDAHKLPCLARHLRAFRLLRRCVQRRMRERRADVWFAHCKLWTELECTRVSVGVEVASRGGASASPVCWGLSPPVF